MSTFLSRVGRFSARFRWVVIGAWLVVFAVLTGVLAAGSSGSDDAAEPTPAGATLQLVFHPDNGDVADPATTQQIDDVLADAAALPGVQSVSDPLDPAAPYVSQDSSLAVATLTYGALTEDQQVTSYDAALALQEDAPASLGTELGGNLVPLGAPEQGPGEAIGVLVAFVVLALTFGSLVTAGVNLLLAAFGVGVGLVGILAYGSLTPIDDNSIILAAMLGLAVGIDYSLFILSRFRNELRGGRTVDNAIARATGTAGTAVVFAGLTVIVALVAFTVAGIPTITDMGIAAAFSVAVAVLLALTLLPALMRFLGVRALSNKQRQALARGELWDEGQPHKRGILASWGGFVVKRPTIALVGGILTLVIVAIPLLSMKTAFSVPGGTDPSSTERTAYNLIVDEFGGVQSPLVVVAEGNGIAAQTAAVESELAGYDGVQSVQPAQVNAAGDTAQIVVVPTGGPIDDATEALVHQIRGDADTIPGVQLEVTGQTAYNIDQDEALATALIKYVLVIVAISIVLLIVLFRSLLIPVIATLGFLLSVGASFGASVAVFQWGWLDPLIAAPQGDPMLSLLPLLLVGVLFGLAMDYQVFLVSRIQEMHRKGLDPKTAIREGFARSAPVLVAAASIMVVVFAGFATSSFAVGASIAFGLMVGVAADAFIVRLVLMPAALSLLGRSAWYIPRWLDKVLPDVDVEGHSLDDVEPGQDRQPVLVG